MSRIIENLILNKKKFKNTSSFSDKPGIYALFFTGDNFIIDNVAPSEEQIIYIGKTQKSQKSRDVDTHFKSGKTGSSTIRKTIGSLLFKKYNLIPIPRNNTDYIRKRKSHFTFDHDSENIITDWMVDNLGLSFFEFDGSTSELDIIESKLICELKPIFNIDKKNLLNPHRKYLMEMRKICADKAFSSLGDQKTITTISQNKNSNVYKNSDSSKIIVINNGKYYDLWKDVLSQLFTKNEQILLNNIVLNEAEFASVGNRKSYTFNLVIDNGIVINNISGSAVARDLYKAIADSLNINLKGKRYKFSMGKDFILRFGRT